VLNKVSDDVVFNPWDFTQAWDRTVTYRAYADGDDKDEEDDDKDGTGEDDKDGEGSSGTGTDKSQGDETRDPEAKAKSQREAKYRTERNQFKKDLEAANQRLKELDDKDKTELELAKTAEAEATKRADKAEAALSVANRKLAFMTSGSADMVKDSEVALNLLKLDDLEPDDEGEYDKKEILSRTEELLKVKPYLKAEDASGEDGEGQSSSGRPANGKKKVGKEESMDALKKKFPALQSR